MDSRERDAWRRWTVEASAEAAIAWARAHGHAMQRKGKDLFLTGVIDSQSPGDRVEAVLLEAAELFVDRPQGQVLLADLDWLTECHYWLLGDVSPSTLRKLSAFYEANGMTLRTGDEDEAREDISRARGRKDGASRWKLSHDNVKRELDWEKKKCERLASDVEKLKKEIAGLRNGDELKRLEKRLNEMEWELRKARDKSASIEILRRENERLVKLVQEANKKQ